MWTSLTLDILTELVNAWRGGNRNIRLAIGASGVLFSLGLLIALVSYFFLPDQAKVTGQTIAGALAVIGLVISIGVYALQKSNQLADKEKKIQDVEKRAQASPKEPQLAWELARVKLESYLDRNLSQVRSIFLLTVVVMTCGFILIGIGAYRAFYYPEHFKASVLSSLSGIIVSFIGGTFLVLYRSTMAQAKDYVTILERINAVGMSVQILDSLPDSVATLKNQTTADVAMQLLTMYSVEPFALGLGAKK
jgi:hypothetical protein